MFLISSILTTTFALPALGQTKQTERERRTEKVRGQIRKLGTGVEAKIKVKLYNDTVHQGYVGQSSVDDFVVVDRTGNETTVKYSDVRSVVGRNLSTGAKIAIGIGIGAAATIGILIAIFASLND